MEKVNAIVRHKDDIGFYSTNTDGSILKFELDQSRGENILSFSAISRQLRWLQGEVLTVLEASINDERQLNAAKQLVKDKFSSKISWVYEICGCPENEEHALPEGAPDEE